MKKIKKKFRLNVCVSYAKGININNFQNPIHSILKNIAWLYRLDYFIDDDTRLFDDELRDNPLYSSTDLIYFRSMDDSEIDLKAFQKIIKELFSYSNPFINGVEVNYQIQKVLNQYPFPDSFIRPLNYPYLEIFENGKGKIMIPEIQLLQLDLTEKRKTDC